MKAAILRAPRAPIEIADIPVPEPGPGQVRLKMEACGVCHSDVFISGAAHLPKAPLVLGHEGVGIVEALGPEVQGIAPGDRVGIAFLHRACGECDYCRTGRETCCARQLQTGYHVDGALAEYALADAGFVVPIPASLTPEQAAPICCAGLTAYKALRTAGLRRDEWVAIFGAGGLGHLAIQLARHMGLRVAVVDIVPEKLQQAVELGADLVINGAVQKPRDAVKAAAAITFTGAAAAVGQAFQTLKPNGILVLVGLSSEPFPLPLLPTVLQELRIAGVLVGSREDLREAFRLAAAGHMSARIEPCGLEDVPAVIERMKQGAVAGRAVVRFP